MDARIANRLIELVLKWQQPFSWQSAFKQADAFRDHRDKATQDHVAAKRMQENGQQGEMLELFRRDAERHEELSEAGHRFVIAAHQELIDLENLVRHHMPSLLKFVPSVNFLFDQQLADLSPCLRDLRELEGAVRAAMTASKQKPGKPRTIKPKKPTVKLGKNPQILLDGNAIALTFEQARWLKALIDAGDWMSDSTYKRENNTSTYKRENNTPNSRPDRLRKRRQVEILAHVETKNIGSRWK